MKSQAIRADLLMLLAAAIWGFAFVAQREGMETMGPFLFNTQVFYWYGFFDTDSLVFVEEKEGSRK